MINADDAAHVLPCLPTLLAHSGPLLDEFMRAASIVRLPEGRSLFVEGDEPQGMSLVVSGSVRVFKLGHNGREVTLYRFGRGDGCILTITAILTHQPFPARATVEEAVEALVVPAGVFRRWVHAHEPWRTFVFALLARRLAAVLSLVDDVLFQRLDTRVASFLVDRCRTASPIHVTHQEIADELGSSREVISRILEEFAAAGLIRGGRGLIDVIDPQALHARSLR